MANLLYATAFKTCKLNVGGGINNSQTTGIILDDVTGVDTNKPGEICITYATPLDTSTYEIVEYSSINGSKELQGVARGASGSTARSHLDQATVAFVISADYNNRIYDKLSGSDTTVITDANGNEILKKVATSSAVNEITVTNAATGNAPELSATGGDTNISFKLKGKGTGTVQVYDPVTASYVNVGSAAFWQGVPGTPTRVSDTQFTITDASNTNSYDLLFKKGVILRWLESSTVNVGMVISSSYATDTVTINIVGDSLTAGFTAMKYCIQMAQTLDFIIPGTLAAGTDLARTHYATTALCKLSVDSYVKTAGTTDATVFDINDDGTTIITTKPSIASGATSDIDNACDAPTTVIAQGSLITADVDSTSTTAPVEAYLKLFVFPQSWLYRS